MKYGSTLKEQKTAFHFYYIDYDQLKSLLKAGTTSGKFTEKHEADFVEALERELEKVASFCSIKGDELTRRVQHCEELVDSILKKAKDTDSQVDTDSFASIEQEITSITTEVGELSKFVRLNYSGFIKILKKHDKHTEFMLKTMFMVRLNARPFYKQSFDMLIIRLSKLYDTLRTGGKREAPPPPTGTSFVRRTTKYWVHPDNVTEVKIHILKNLPVLVFSKTGKDDPAISSIYFDNDSFDLYLGRLEKHEGAQALRLRWYGNMDQTEVFVERKTHREDWTGETSVKERFPIKEKYVNAYLRGEYTMDHTIQKMRDRGLKSEKELNGMQTLSTEVQQSVASKGLKPMVRTFYNRTAFQLPGDACVRISLDTELTMIREDNFGRPRSGNNWRRLDAGTIAPFTHLPEEDVCSFPYAILEVKLQTQHGTEAPKWVDDLIKSHLVEEVPKFSKFIHGVSTLLENRVSLLPFWLPQMDKDIRKRPADNWGAFPPLRPDNIEILVDQPTPASSFAAANGNRNRASRDEQDETTPLLNGARRTDARSAEQPGVVASVTSFFTNHVAPFFSRAGDESATATTSNGIPRQFKNKRIALPVRIEPKVFFANERTFLSWLHFCIVLGGLALGLLNFGDVWRAHKIRTRDAGPYDDRTGPTVLVIVLFFAVMTNFYLKFTTH
ncbi:VTC domain-containing protein [Entophlyctis helioformis]|nr:VTC domain-containing protein [Entophlyctis helioformis]